MATPDEISADERDALEAALPGYNVGAVLGRGAHGVVVSGWHIGLGRAVAIKQLAPHLVGDESARSRFASEARLLAALDHPHIVPVYDYVADGPLCLLVMEHMVGGSVADRLAGRSFAPDVACATVLAICAGLQHAHERGVVHRDVKPVNVLYSATSTVKIADFGIAKVLGGGDSGSTSSFTIDGAVLGTPEYLAPEQARGEPAGPQVDVYASGVVLFELLSDRLPFPEDVNPTAAVYRRAHEPAQSLSSAAPSIPAAIAEVVDRALSSSLDVRYATVEELGTALAEAGGEVWGPDWLHRPGMPNVVSASLLRAASGRRTTGRSVDARSATRATPVARMDPARADRASLDVVPTPASAARRPNHRRLRRAAAAVGVVLALGGAGALLLREDDNGSTGSVTTVAQSDPGSAGSTPESTPESTGDSFPGSIPNVPLPPDPGASYQAKEIGKVPIADVTTVLLSAADGRLVVGTASGEVSFWNVAERTADGDAFVTGTGSPIDVLAVNGDGSMAAAVSLGNVFIWNAESGEPVGPPISVGGPVTAIAFNAAAQYNFEAPTELVTADLNGMIQRWDPVTGVSIGLPLVGHDGVVNALAYNSDGNRLASAGVDGTVRLWNVGTGQPASGPLLGHVASVTSVTFDATDSFVVSASSDQTVRIWNVSTGKQLGDPYVIGETQALFPADPVASMASSQRSVATQAIAVSGDGGLTFLDFATGEVLGGIPASATVFEFTVGFAVIGENPEMPPSAVAVAVDLDRAATVYSL